MKVYAPSYYGKFHCIGGACRHTCCVGWEVGIDGDTLCRMAVVGGAFGERLCASVDFEEGVFRLLPGDRCPMLREDGLCDLILEMGEDGLPMICDEHPRYTHTLSHRTEVGLGMSCEEACRLLLASPLPLSLVPVGEDGEEERSMGEEEAAVLALREECFAILGREELSLAEKEDAILRAAGGRVPDAEGILALLRPLERMDTAWDVILARTPSDPAASCAHGEQMLFYFLHRHLTDAPTPEEAAARVSFAVLSRRAVSMLSQGDEGEVLRAYSAEVEYSEENVEELLSALRLGLSS